MAATPPRRARARIRIPRPTRSATSPATTIRQTVATAPQWSMAACSPAPTPMRSILHRHQPARARSQGIRASTCWPEPPLLCRLAGARRGIVVEHGRKPFLRLHDRPVLAPGIIFNLITFDLADAEVMTFGMAEIESAHGRARPHRKAFRERDADRIFAAHEREQRRLFRVIGLRGITGRRANAAIFFRDQILRAERLVSS